MHALAAFALDNILYDQLTLEIFVIVTNEMMNLSPEPETYPELPTLTPGLYQQYAEHCRGEIAPYRWRRFIIRLMHRALWHAKGLLLWLAGRSYLRYVPFPYPAIGSVKDWMLQAQNMVNQSVLSSAHHRRALEQGHFTTQNLMELSKYRDRVGWKLAFLEDTLIHGLLLSRSMKGQAQRLRAAALEEARDKVKKESANQEREIMARQMIGPLGGLPHLRADLVRLALLLNVTVDSKDTVVILQSKIRPMVETLKNAPVKPTKSEAATRPRSCTSASWSVPTGVAEMTPPVRSTSGWPKGADYPDQLLQMEQKVSADGRSRSEVPGDDGSGHACDSTWPGPKSRRSNFGSGGLDAGRLNVLNVDDDLKVSGKLKPGVKQLISQAWEKHRRDQKAISCSAREINQIFEATWLSEMNASMNETFSVEFVFPNTLATEVFTDTEPIAKAVRRRGLHAGSSLTLSSGWDSRRPRDRQLAFELLKRDKPYVVVLAFPCGPWSPLQNLNPSSALHEMREEALELVKFAIEVALFQLAHSRHYVMENPRPSAAWQLELMKEFIHDSHALEVVFDMCHFNLRNVAGEFHRKRTKL